MHKPPKLDIVESRALNKRQSSSSSRVKRTIDMVQSCGSTAVPSVSRPTFLDSASCTANVATCLLVSGFVCIQRTMTDGSRVLIRASVGTSLSVSVFCRHVNTMRRSTESYLVEHWHHSMEAYLSKVSNCQPL